MTEARATGAALLRGAVERLAGAGVPTPDVDAELLLRHVTGWSRAGLLTRGAEAPPAGAAGAFAALVTRRAAREPLQHLLGSVGFRHLQVLVRPGVFVPRPETEVLAGEAVDRVPAGGVVVEPCTGTAAVACAVASERPGLTVVATDVSAAAVALARENAARCRVAVDVRQGDLLAPVPATLHGVVDVLVCNPPYLAADEAGALEPEVRADPAAALVAGPTGHEVTDRLLAEARAWLRPGGWLLLETDTARAPATGERARARGYTDVAVLPDLTGRDRIVVARHRT